MAKNREKNAQGEPQPELPSNFYEVEEILNKRLTSNGMMYLIRWKNYPDPKDFTWEPIQHLTEVEDLVREFNISFDKKTTPQKLDQCKIQSKKTPNKLMQNLKKDSDAESQVEEREEKPTTKKRGRPRLTLMKEKKEEPLLKKPTLESQSESEEQIKPYRLESKKMKEPATFKGAKQNSDNQESQIDKFWEKQGYELGRIHKHFRDEKQLLFCVNINKEDLVCGTVYLPCHVLEKTCEEKLIDYMENWVRNHLIEKSEQASEQFLQFNRYWKQIE